MPFILFLSMALFLVLRNPNPLNSFMRTVSYGLMLLTIPSYFIKELNRDAKDFLWNIVWFCVLFLTIGLIMILLVNNWVFIGGRYNGLFGNPNGVGIMCTLLTILIAVTRHHFPDIFSRTELYFIYAVIITSILLSSSRNCIFSLMIFLFFMRFYKISYLYGFIIVIVVAVVFQFINENLIFIIDSLGLGSYFRVEHLDDGSGRLVAWTFAWEEIQRNFYAGRGFGFDKYYFELHKDYLSSLGHQGGVHNSYLTIWMNTGLIGLILFIIAYFRIFFKAATINYLAIPAMFAIMFSISFESWAASSLSPFTIIFLLIITLLQYQKNESPAQEALVPLQ